MRHAVLAVALLLGLTPLAAADTVRLIVHSDPAGATVYVNTDAARIGYASVELRYEMGRRFYRDRRCQATAPIEVRWPSGVTARLTDVSLCGADGKRQAITFRRPVREDGLVDEGLALDVAWAQQLLLVGQQARASAGAASAAWRAALLQSAVMAQPTYCTSIRSINIVQTMCR